MFLSGDRGDATDGSGLTADQMLHGGKGGRGFGPKIRRDRRQPSAPTPKTAPLSPFEASLRSLSRAYMTYARIYIYLN